MSNNNNNNNNNTNNKENSTNTPSSFSFKYVESGGLANNYLVISFDSESNNLKLSTDMSGTDLTQKENEDNTAISFSLTVTIDVDIHTAVWTNNSQEVPAELVEITNEIKKIAHEKKMI